MAFWDFLEEVACVALKTNITYWQTVLALSGAKKAGAIKNLDECHAAGKVGSAVATQYGIPTFISETFGNCACKAVFGNASGPVIAYEHENFQGSSQGFLPGVYRADQGQLGDVGNDSITSIRVAPGFRVGLWENEDESGNYEEFGPGEYHLKWKDDGGVADQVSKIRVWEA